MGRGLILGRSERLRYYIQYVLLNIFGRRKRHSTALLYCRPTRNYRGWSVTVRNARVRTKRNSVVVFNVTSRYLSSCQPCSLPASHPLTAAISRVIGSSRLIDRDQVTAGDCVLLECFITRRPPAPVNVTLLCDTGAAVTTKFATIS